MKLYSRFPALAMVLLAAPGRRPQAADPEPGIYAEVHTGRGVLLFHRLPM